MRWTELGQVEKRLWILSIEHDERQNDLGRVGGDPHVRRRGSRWMWTAGCWCWWLEGYMDGTYNKCRVCSRLGDWLKSGRIGLGKDVSQCYWPRSSPGVSLNQPFPNSPFSFQNATTLLPAFSLAIRKLLLRCRRRGQHSLCLH